MAEAVEAWNPDPHSTLPERSAEAAVGQAAFGAEPEPRQLRLRMIATGAHVIVQGRDGVVVEADDAFASVVAKNADGPPLQVEVALCRIAR
jgi:hypothetical protein